MLASDVADISDTGIALHPQQFFEGLATLFAAGLLARLPGPVLWCLRGRDLFAPALSRVGLHPERLIFCETWKDHEVLPAMEEGLRCKGLAGVVGELVALPLKTSRRLQLAAAETGVTALAIHRWRKHGGSGLDNREPKPYSSTPRHVRAGPAHRQSKGEGAEFHMRAHSRIAAKAAHRNAAAPKAKPATQATG